MALNRSDKSRILRRYFPGMTRNSEMSTEPSSINPWWVVLGILVTSVLWAISLRLDGGLTSIATLTQATVLIIAVLDVIAIPITAGLVIHMQSNLNRYWDGLTNYRVVSHRLGVGEIIFAIVGSLMWIDTLADIFNESWRTGF